MANPIFQDVNVSETVLQSKYNPATGFGERASGVDLGAGLGLSLIIDSNFKLKAFADLESVRLNGGQPWLNTLAIGFSSAWFW